MKMPKLASQERVALFFIAPTLLLFFIFTVIPIIMALFLSLTNYDIISQMAWVGLRNYERLLTDSILWTTFQNVLIFSLMFVPLNILVSLSLALLLFRGSKIMHFFRTIYYMPTVTSAVAASTVWIWVLHSEYGLINQMLSYIGITGPAWLAEVGPARMSVVMVTLWMSVGSNMVIYLAGLQGIPGHLYESAQLDGASRFQRLRFITWPMLRPTTFFVSTMSIIGALQIFDQAYVLTQGGPANATKTVVYHIYQTGFNQLQMGYASSQAFVLAIAILILTVINLRINKEETGI